MCSETIRIKSPVSQERSPLLSRCVSQVKGLYTAMSATSSSTGRQPMVWVGWAGLNDATPTEELSLRAELASRDCVPVVLRQEACGAYFDGYCSDVLWPLLHGGDLSLGAGPLDHEAQWQAYVEVGVCFHACISP